MGNQAKLKSNLVKLQKIHRLLMTDLMEALGQLEKFQPKPREPPSHEYLFAVRASVRTFFSLMEGVSYFMRSTVAKPSNVRSLGLSEKQRAKLLELRFDKSSGRAGSELRSNSVGENLKLGFRYFAQLYDADFALDTGGESWQIFLKVMVPARNEMTHESQLEDFYCLEVIQTFNVTKAWFLRSLADLLRACCPAVGVAVENDKVAALANRHETRKLNDIQEPEKTRKEFRAEVAKGKGKSTDWLLETFLRLQARELDRSATILGQIVLGKSKRRHSADAFATRDFFRIAGMFVEGAAASLRMYLEFASSRDEISLSAEEVEAMEQNEPISRLCAVANLFSLHHGSGGKLDGTSPEWQAMQTVMRIRDRLTHPKSLKDLFIEPKNLQGLLTNVLKWELELLSVVELDKGKFHS